MPAGSGTDNYSSSSSFYVERNRFLTMMRINILYTSWLSVSLQHLLGTTFCLKVKHLNVGLHNEQDCH